MKSSSEKKKVEVCSSPLLFDLYDSSDSIVVVIDVLRATSSICVAFEHGAEKIIPVAGVEETRAYKEKGFVIAAERDGEKLDGFDLGNSPFGFMGDTVKGKSIAISTTNGTQAIHVAGKSKQVVIGSFLNLDVLCEWLVRQESNVLCLCSGWKNRFNLEDTLLAGAIVQRLKNSDAYHSHCDSAIAAEHLYQLAKKDLFGFLENSSHRRRLKKLHIERDIEYCLTPNQAPVIPVLQGGVLVKLIEVFS
ncbi:MAG: 2-phosphosulfolactate phosphatase [Bacteroidetes bacterium]|nr:2-phosphosulfolactate phosphatase [Bacteroidota bacterium]